MAGASSASEDVDTLLMKHPILNLSDESRIKFIQKIKQRFTDAVSLMFIVSVYYVVSHNSTADCVIDLSDVVGWLELTSLLAAKRTIFRLFVENADYKIVKPSSKDEGPGAVFLNVRTFKAMCKHTNTVRSLRCLDDLGELETIFRDIVIEQLGKVNEILVNTQTALDFKTKEMARALRKNYLKDDISGDVVYIFQDGEKVKVGKTINLRNRIDTYITHNAQGEIVFAKQCLNADLLERVVHHMLSKHRDIFNREWFTISVENAKAVVESAACLMDQFIPYMDSFTNEVTVSLTTTLDMLKERENMPLDTPYPIPKPTHYENPLKAKSRQIEELKQLTFQKDESVIRAAKLTKNVQDLSLFVTECCDLADGFQAIKAEVEGAYKLWSRSATIEGHKTLVKYLDEHYKKAKVFYPEYDATLLVYKGMQLKPFTLKLANPETPSEYERFIQERCKLGYICRISYQALLHNFEDWKQGFMLDYALNVAEKRLFQDYINNIFYPATVYLHKTINDMPGCGTSSHGVWGITLKEDETFAGIKLSNKLRKTVYQVDIKTNAVVATFPSVTSAARTLNISASAISANIRFKRVRDGCYFTFTPVDPKDAEKANAVKTPEDADS